MTPIALRSLRALALAAGLAGAAEADAACGITVSDITSAQWTGARGRGYDVYDPQRRIQVVNFRVRSHDGGCPFFLTVSPVSGRGDGIGYLMGPGGLLSYGLFKDASGNDVLRPEGIAIQTDVYSGVAPTGGSSMAFQLVVSLPPEQMVRPGLYSGEIEFALHEGAFGMGILRDRRRVVVSAQVPAVAEISFSEGAGFDWRHNSVSMNFGRLRAGDRQSVQLKVRGNGGQRIALRSLNGGMLRHVDASDDSQVRYTLRVDGAPIGLSENVGTQIVLNNDNLPSAGRAYVLEISIGDIGDASAGDYRDTLSIDVQSLH